MYLKTFFMFLKRKEENLINQKIHCNSLTHIKMYKIHVKTCQKKNNIEGTVHYIRIKYGLTTCHYITTYAFLILKD